MCVAGEGSDGDQLHGGGAGGRAEAVAPPLQQGLGRHGLRGNDDGSSDDDDDDGYDEVPAMENSAVFVMTNVVITPNQSRAECAESAGLWNCARDADCPPGGVNNLGGR